MPLTNAERQTKHRSRKRGVTLPEDVVKTGRPCQNGKVLTNAERCKGYYDRRKAAGFKHALAPGDKERLKKYPRNDPDPRERFLSIQFIALDGEGKDVPIDWEHSEAYSEMYEENQEWEAWLIYREQLDYWSDFKHEIKVMGGIRLPPGKFKSDWINVVPRELKRKDGLYPDQISEELKRDYPHFGVVDEASFYDLLSRYASFRNGPKMTRPDTWRRQAEGFIPWPDDHIYTLLACSDGSYLENQAGLRTETIFDYLLSLRKEHANKHKKKVVMVGYGLNYDVVKWLTDLDHDALTILAETNCVFWKAPGGAHYRIEWYPFKWFTLSKGHYDIKTESWVADKGQVVRVWDVIGFFQQSFVQTLKDWGVGKEYLEFIEEMKAKRGEFDQEQPEKIREYCLKECSLLVELMIAFRNALAIAEIYLQKWHGAGAIGSYLLKQNGVDEHLEKDLPPDVQNAIIKATFGGRIEVIRAGRFSDCWKPDVNSAYPSVNINLPSWRDVTIYHSTQWVEYEWSVWKVHWDIPRGFTRICPFPFRYEDGSIDFPLNGTGWYWYPEVKAALEIFPDMVHVLEGHIFQPSYNIKPFEFIRTKYQQRLDFKSNLDPAIKSAELPVKLGLNSLFGKQMQHVGRYKPPHQSFINAGYITSAIRAKLFLAAHKDPESVIMFATDGLLSTHKLLENDPGKPLGGWEVKQIKEAFVLQSGVYRFVHRENDKLEVKTRGFGKSDLDWQVLIDQWEREGFYWSKPVVIHQRKFIGLKWAAFTQNWHLLGKWVRLEKKIQPRVKGWIEGDYDPHHKWGLVKKNYLVFPPQVDEENQPESATIKDLEKLFHDEYSKALVLDRLIIQDNQEVGDV